MRDIITERIKLLKQNGGLSEPEVKNKEWLYLLKEESRNSIMIEGFFVSEKELEEVLAGQRAQKRAQEEVLNYFKSATYSYGLAYENYRVGELIFGIPVIRQMNKTIAGKGEFRRGDARITEAKIVPPPFYYIEDWMTFFEAFVKQGFSSNGFLKFLAQQHVIFESIHPFEDGNGRTGRIIMNYLLISNGYPSVILKGDDKNKERYYKALEQGDKVLRELTAKAFALRNITRAMQEMQTSYLEELISENLRISLDRILATILEDKKELKLKPAKEVASILGYSADSMRTLISRGKFVAVKRGKEWMTHEKLSLGKT